MKFLILGLGQDALLMSRHLDRLGFDYRFLCRRSSGVVDKIHFYGINKNCVIYTDVIDEAALLRTHIGFEFTHVFNFAANSFVQDSKINFESFLRNNSSILWSLLRFRSIVENVWIFHPLSSEILSSSPINGFNGVEICPRNAYGVAKAADYYACDISRNQGNDSLHSCVLFNHESSLRPSQFFTKKVCNYFRAEKQAQVLQIYNAKSQRDWGSAEEYMSLLLKSALSKFNGVSMLGTGHLMSVEYFIDTCFSLKNEPFEKTEYEGLLLWKSENFEVRETARDPLDLERCICADPNAVLEAFKERPTVKGRALIEGLLNGSL